MAQQLAFLDLQLTPLSITLKSVIDDQFTVTKKNGNFLDQAMHIVHDKEADDSCILYTMRTDIDNGLRKSNFLNFLSKCEGVRGWPKLVKSVTLGEYESWSGIITTYQGEHFRTIFDRTFAISYQNGLRLCYQLFDLLDTIHALGYVHRSIDLNTIRGRVTWDDEFVIGLNGFRYTAPIEPAPECYGMHWMYSSIYVNRNEPYNRIDDFISVIYVILTSQGIDMFQGSVGYAMRTKQVFHDDPRAFLTDSRLHWIADIYKELVNQRENGVFDRTAIWVHLVVAVEGCDPSYPLEWSPVSRDSSDVKLNANLVMVPARAHPRGPIRVANL